jgi:hypothetical protein
VHGVDRCEDLVATRSHPGGQALAHELMTLGDHCRVPGPTVLLVEGDQFAARRPGGAAGLGQEHQRQEPGHLTVVRHEGTDQASEPDRLGGQVVTYGIGVGAGRQVALVEDEEEDGEYAGDACREILRGRYPITDASRLDLGLRAGDPLAHGGLDDPEVGEVLLGSNLGGSWPCGWNGRVVSCVTYDMRFGSTPPVAYWGRPAGR